MCYREELPPLEFGELHVACLSGSNGAGKSALLDAITWALWGRGRSRSDDDLIARGAQEMEVEFEFLLEGNHYRVFRRRDRGARGGRGKGQLDLQVYGPLGWRSMAGDSIRQTGKAIVGLLRMDYDTFINSAFLLQGRADEFTVKPPAERKRILADILGLAYYDALEQKARERLRAEERTVEALALTLEDQERQLSTREQQEQVLAHAQEEVVRAEQETAHAQDELAGLQGRIAELEAIARQVQDLRQRLVQIEEEAARLDEQQSEQEGRLATTQTLLQRAEEIEADHAELQNLRERNQAMAQAAGRLLALSERQRSLEQAIERARNEHVTEREVLRRSLAEIEQQLKERPAIERRLEEIQAELDTLREKETAHEVLLQESQEHNAEIKVLRAECQRLREEMDQLREKLDLLEESTTHCPLCQSALQQETIENIRLVYQTEGREKRDLYRSRKARIQQLEARLAELQGQKDGLERELRHSRVLEQQRASLEKEADELNQRTEEKITKEQRLEEIEQVLADRAYAAPERNDLAELEKEVADLHYDRDEHESLQQELTRLGPVEEEYRHLQTARERLDEEQRRLDELHSARDRRQEEAAAEHERLLALQAQIDELPALLETRQKAQTSLDAAQQALGQARLALGAAQGELERLREVEEAYEERKRTHQEALDRRAIYDELSKSLGKRGVQAMLIETAVPEIEREANELLHRMTDGEMAVQLAMQRATKQGSLTETLDINISDMQGTRSYESYSGGEKFRINFALRIALSRLLAHRAGASLQTLVIDEGFGTQDVQGRERLVEAIQSIQDEFEKILVITHIQELKDLFPAHIDIVKTPEGSRWTIV